MYCQICFVKRFWVLKWKRRFWAFHLKCQQVLVSILDVLRVHKYFTPLSKKIAESQYQIPYAKPALTNTKYSWMLIYIVLSPDNFCSKSMPFFQFKISSSSSSIVWKRSEQERGYCRTTRGQTLMLNQWMIGSNTMVISIITINNMLMLVLMMRPIISAVEDVHENSLNEPFRWINKKWSNEEHYESLSIVTIRYSVQNQIWSTLLQEK